jgi:hypothetical protein
MATIPDAAERHVRASVTLDGSANNGNLGDVVPLFTLTGRVRVTHATAYVSSALSCAAPTGTYLYLWAGSVGTGSNITTITDGADFTGLTGFLNGEGPAAAAWSNLYVAVAEDIGLYVEDYASGADVTAGTIIVDLWYVPITDDGALAGDDIDSGRPPANVTAISGDTTAADRLESLMDGIVAGIVGTGSTTTSIANCTGFTEATNDHFNGRLITFLTGNLAGQQTQITDYVGSTQTFTCAALTEAPANTDTFVIS